MKPKTQRRPQGNLASGLKENPEATLLKPINKTYPWLIVQFALSRITP
ncbi:hypothetical protein HMPREF0578_2023 [Mobiluncus mulieris 28-1]|nr:hypothetical protein HMPREF0578_2023 [Mobiluncus mulieris 28-1]